MLTKNCIQLQESHLICLSKAALFGVSFGCVAVTTVVGVVMLVMGYCIGIHCQCKTKSSMTPQITSAVNPVDYEEIPEWRVTLNKNVAYEQVTPQ